MSEIFDVLFGFIDKGGGIVVQANGELLVLVTVPPVSVGVFERAGEG